MDIKSKARLAGWFEPAEWTKEMEVYRSLLEQETHYPLPSEMLLHYAGALTDKEKLAIALTLEFPFAKRELRKWPEMLFAKMLRTAVQQAQRSIAVKRRILLSILQLLPFEIHETIPFDALLREKDERITANGFWPYYWMLYFHEIKLTDPELWLHELKKLEERLHSYTAPRNDDRNGQTAGPASPSESDDGKHDKKLKLLESMYKKELSARQRAEHELAQKDKLLRMKSKELSQLEDELERLRDAAEHADSLSEQQTKLQQDRERKWKQEQTGWLEERQSFLQHLRSLNAQQGQLQRTIDAQRKELQEQQAETALLQEELSDARKQLLASGEWTDRLCRSLEDELAGLGQAIASQDRSAIARSRMRKVLDLLDALEAYRDMDGLEERDDPACAAERRIEVSSGSAAGAHTPAASHSGQEAFEAVSRTVNLPPQYGTFYRRDHGGCVTLENGDSFNITESLVQQHGLQHEAELLCTPVQQPGKPLYYELQLLFQGDDAFSPIQQFDGYIEKGDGPLWFCVDMNDPACRYQLHHRDVDIQKPSPGDPCTFNVADGGHIARLTKVYRQSAPHSAGEEQKPKQSAQAQAELAAAGRRGKEKREPAKAKQPPFLHNCVITIVGGVRKWFEAVVRECGAELAHDSGDHPERVMSDLRRSQALFLLITSTSHRATWEGVDIAKTNGIPHFVIQGSKSNLRSLLWENRELILASNR
ncbi:hypothetical protein [Paenibacillus soyae]|uniref:DUF2325 domain-containing protein n=1 Tax=Paenibacillus soyae TaxID=2969249 RepID=A0A9X2SAY9_9BACL|nr:hypothetical protein [Paenibacillus soyae]MCR2806465.1 hypothetical protein [Paenibacillus soyae]